MNIPHFPKTTRTVSGERTESALVILERDPRDRDKPERKVDRWIAWYGEDLLVEGSRDPEHDACRELLKMGITGKVAFRHKGSSYASMIMDIEKAAKVSVVESTDKKGLHRVKYVPFPVPRSSRTARNGESDGSPYLKRGAGPS